MGVLVGRDGISPWTFLSGKIEPGGSPEDAAVERRAERKASASPSTRTKLPVLAVLVMTKPGGRSGQGSAAQLIGHDIGALIDQITAAPMDRARFVSSILHYRLQQLSLPDLRHAATGAQRAPATAPPVAHELAAGLDDRARALGERLAASPEPWLARHLGVLAPDASSALREEYTRRAGVAAAYREAARITNPEQAVSLEPHRGDPELEIARKAVFTALEIRDEADIIRSLDRGELEARALRSERGRAAAPPDVSSQLRLTAQAEADAHRQCADARTQHDHTGAASAATLAAQLAAERQRLEADNARYEQWSADTHATRDTAGKATAELQRRGHAHPEGEPQPEDGLQRMPGWWQQLEEDAEAADYVDVSEPQGASNTGEPQPSQRVPDMNPPSDSKPEPRTSLSWRLRPRPRPGSGHKPGTKSSSSCYSAARARSRTGPLIRMSIKATACASLPQA